MKCIEKYEAHTTGWRIGPSPMIDVASLPSAVQAAILIGTVLVEAIILYVAYGALTNAVGPRVKRALGGA